MENNGVSSGKPSRIVPNRIAHLVVRTNKYANTVAWYQAVFEANIVFANDALTFLTFDDEHHRIAIAYLPDLLDITAKTSAIDHVAFTYDHIGDLLTTYQRLKKLDIMPTISYNHGPTTSFYYSDPNSNSIELQVDNFPTLREASDYFRSEAFAANAIGVLIDPDDLVEKWERGVSAIELTRPAGAVLA